MRDSTVTVERWLPIPGHPGYEASDLGRIRSLDRVIMRSNGRPQTWRGMMLNPMLNPTDGKLWVSVGADRSNRTRPVHRLVLITFRGPPTEGTEGCHNNGNGLDNRLVNLRWGTRSSNVIDSVRHGTNKNSLKTVCPCDHLLVVPNLVASHLKRDARTCLACQRARSAARYARSCGRSFDFRADSDRRYVEIMGISQG
jgi:hypothetical protein